MLCSLRPKLLTAQQEGHQDIEKCRAKARSTIWWPKISLDIQQHVSNCTTCNHRQPLPVEPLLTTDLLWYSLAESGPIRARQQISIIILATLNWRN